MRLCFTQDPFLQWLCEELYLGGGLSCYGIDLIVDEEKQDIWIIDLNDMPSYKGVDGLRGMMDKYFEVYHKEKERLERFGTIKSKERLDK